MKKKYILDPYLILFLTVFFIISVATIYSAQTILKDEYQSLAIKQIFWYIAGIFTIYIITKIKNDSILKITWILYIIGNVFLLLLLFFGTNINNAKCWFTIKGIGTIQPSEFMKIILIITIAKMINNLHQKYINPTVKEEFVFLIKISATVLIPSILTFLEPDTGVVLIYLLITFVMLFISGI